MHFVSFWREQFTANRFYIRIPETSINYFALDLHVQKILVSILDYIMYMNWFKLKSRENEQD